MPKVMKFGGSSLSDYRCFKRAAQSIKNCGAETVVVSAPGKRYKADEKITDLLKKADNHGIFSRRYRRLVAKRMRRIWTALKKDESVGIFPDSDAEFDAVLSDIFMQFGDCLLSRGEYFSAVVMSKILGYELVDAKEVIIFGDDGQPDLKSSILSAKAVLSGRKAVVPGFYGADKTGSVRVLPRGGSDITGAVIAAAVGAEQYLNCTDVPGVMRADPDIIKKAQAVGCLTLCQMYGLALAGADVVHPDAAKILCGGNVEMVVKGAFSKERGTVVSCRNVCACGAEICDRCKMSRKMPVADYKDVYQWKKTSSSGAISHSNFTAAAVSGRDGLIAVAYDGDCESKAAECVLGTLAAQGIYAESAYFLGSGCLMLKIKSPLVTKALRVLYGAFIER